MNILRKFNSLKTWQKLGIGISLLTIFKYFLMTNFVINVQAESNSEVPSVVVYDLDTGLPISEPISCNYGNGFCSNIQNSNEIGKYSTYWQYFNNQPPQSNSNLHQLTQSNVNQDIQIGHVDYYFTGISFYANSGDSTKYIKSFNPNTHYSMVFSIIHDGIEPYSDIITTSDLDFYLFGYNREFPGEYNLSNYLQNLEVVYYPGGSINNNKQWSFFKVDFDTTPTLTRNLLLSKVMISTKSSTQDKYLFVSDDEVSYVGVRLFTIVQDATLQLIPASNTNEFFGWTSGIPLKEQIYEDCDTLDIACHVRNIQKGIENFGKNIIYNLVATFNYIFVPDFNNIHNRVETLRDTINSKYPDILGFFDYLEYMYTRFQNLQPKTSFSFSGVKVPFFENDSYIIPPFTFDFATIINDEEFHVYYVTMRTIYIVILCIGFVLFELRVVKSIIHDLPIDYGGGN